MSFKQSTTDITPAYDIESVLTYGGNRALYRDICNAACSLAAAMLTSTTKTEKDATGGRCDKSDLSYLAMAAGFCGRMALGGIDGPLEDMTEILRITQQSLKESSS